LDETVYKETMKTLGASYLYVEVQQLNQVHLYLLKLLIIWS